MRSRRPFSTGGFLLAVLVALAAWLQGSLSGQHSGGVDPNKLFGTPSSPAVYVKP